MFYYDHHIGDFRAASAFLPATLQYAYLKLLWVYYDTEKPLPNNPEKLAMWAGVSQAKVQLIMDEFFDLHDGAWIHARCQAEITVYLKHKKASSKGGKKRAANAAAKKQGPLKAPSTPLQATSNQEPGTSNRKPGTKNEEPTGTTKSLVGLKPDSGEGKQLFEFWKQTMGHTRSAFNDKRRALINKTLKQYTLTDLMCAVSGCSLTPHNMGDNDRGERYDSIELILRDAAHIDRFMTNNDNPPKGKIRTIERAVDDDQAQASRIRSTLEANKRSKE